MKADWALHVEKPNESAAIARNVKKQWRSMSDLLVNIDLQNC
jgi:hypothetical protein